MDVLMSIVDLVPVILFLVAAIVFQRDLYNKMSKGAFALFSTGTILVFIAGLLKAVYKILGYGFGVNWQALNTCFFPLQTIGFVVAAAGMIAVMIYHQGEGKVYSITLPLVVVGILASFQDKEPFNGTMIFVALMVLGVAILDGCTIYIAAKMKCYVAIILLVVAFIGTMAMGYLSTKPDLSDWYKEIVNSVGQGAYLAGAVLLHKKGLGEPNSLEGIVKAK